MQVLLGTTCLTRPGLPYTGHVLSRSSLTNVDIHVVNSVVMPLGHTSAVASMYNIIQAPVGKYLAPLLIL